MPKLIGRVLLCVALAHAVGCATTSGGGSRESGRGVASAAGRTTDTVWYISARAREAGQDTRRLTDSLEYGYVIHSYRRPEDILDGDIDIRLEDSARVSQDVFVQTMRNTTVSDTVNDFAVLYVHGIGTSLRECWQYVSEARIRSEASAPWVTFCWPSRGSGVAKPTRGAIFSTAYVEDSTMASSSTSAFRQSAELMLDAMPAAQLLIASHSMGAQLLSSALIDTSALRRRLLMDPVRAIAFIAADVDARRFIDTIVPAISPLTSRLVAYTSGRDRMLAISGMRTNTGRAGAPQRVPLRHPDLETVDATEGMVSENWFHHVFGTHHAIRRASAVIFDLMHVVATGRSADCRAALGTATYDDGVWKLTALRPDKAMAVERCPVPSTRLR